MDFEIIKTLRIGNVWVVHIRIDSKFCGCMMPRRVLQFEQIEKPKYDEIKNRL